MEATTIETINDDLVLDTNPEAAKEPTPFLTINAESISLEQAISYLRNSGLWPRVISDIKRQYAIEKELEQKPELQATKKMVNRAIGDVQLQTNTSDPSRFVKWLQSNYLSYDNFYSHIAWTIKIEQFKTKLVEDEEQLKQYFEKRKEDLDRIALSRIVVETREEAEEIKQQLDADPGQFDYLAQQKSLTDDKAMGGRMGPIRRSRLPKDVQEAIEEASPEQGIVGPIESEDLYAVLRIDNILKASLDQEPLKQELRNEMFENWLRDNLKTMNVSLAFEV